MRGYTFCINSGAVEELELDSFGLSIIPSSLVSRWLLSKINSTCTELDCRQILSINRKKETYALGEVT